VTYQDGETSPRGTRNWKHTLQ